MKIKATILLVMVLIFTQIILSPKEASAAQPSVRLGSVKGEVFIRNSGGLHELPAVDGTELIQGDWLRTGKNSTATLSYEDGTEATLGASSYINIQQLTSKDTTSASAHRQAGITSGKDGHQSSIQLWSGSVWSKVNSLINIDDKYEIKTPTAVMGVRGTLFSVSVDQETGSTQSDVIEGSVGVTQNREDTLATPIQLVTMGKTLKLVSLTEPLPNNQVINPQELIKNTQPEILVKLINDIIERTQELASTTKDAQQAFGQTGNIDEITSAIGTSFKLSNLASFGKEFMDTLQKSDKLEEVKKVLLENNQSIEQVLKIADTIKMETEQLITPVLETAKSAGVSPEQIDSIGQVATGDFPKLTEQPKTPPSSSGSGKDPSTPSVPNDTAPTLLSAKVPSTNPNKVVATFSEAMTGLDGSGFGILINNQPAQIVNVTSSSAIVTFTIQPPVCSGAVVQICYDASVGNVVDLASTSNKLASIPLHSVINYSVVSSTVTVSSAAISDSMHIVLTMSGALTGVSGDPTAFKVVGANTCPNVTDVAVSGTSVTLTLSAIIAYGETISVNYAKTGTTDLTNGTLVANFTAQTVTNNLVAVAPTYGSITTSADGTKVLVTFNKAMANPGGGLKAQFNVTVDGAENVVTVAALNADTKIIELTLTTSVTTGQSIQVAYTAGTVTSEDTGVLATFLNQAVINVSTLYISSVAPINVATITGTAPVLPATITVTLSDGTTSRVLVTWSLISGNSYASVGSFTVTGAIANTTVTATANITVTPPLPDPTITY